jgi:DNA-binding LacI/PurR family transcriptional regulator
MEKRKPANGHSRPHKKTKAVGLKDLADYVGLAPATVSLVLSGSPVADTIARDTKELIFAAARKFNYRPNFFASCLRSGRSFTIGVIVPEVSEGYNATLLSGIEDHLLQEGYFYFVASHRFRQDLIDEYAQIFTYRSVDGLIVVSTPWHKKLSIPVVTVSSHDAAPGVTSIVLDHRQAARVALRHLVDLGHRRIAVIKGQEFVPDTEVRWHAIAEAARELGVPIAPALIARIERNSPSPELGYRVTQELLASGETFTALFAFNDVSAIGAIRALHEADLRVPQDVSVVGFDDIESAAYQNPGLTTVQQPLRKMGRMAAETILRRILRPSPDGERSEHVVVEPELVVRGTTSVVAANKKKSRPALSRL